MYVKIKKLLKKIYNLIFLENDNFINFIFKSFNRINSSKLGYKFNLNSRLRNETIYLDDKKLKRKYQNYFLLTDKKYKIITKLKDIKQISTTTNLKSNDIYDSIFFILLNTEENLLREIDTIKLGGGYYLGARMNLNDLDNDYTQTTSYRFTNSKCLQSLKHTYKNKNKISHFSKDRVTTHENLCEGLELTKNVDGDYVEIGVYKGGSALTALKYIQLTNQKRYSYLIDTYEGFNYEASKESSDVIWQNTHLVSSDVQDNIKDTLKDFKNFELIKADIVKDKLPDKIKKISLAHIDVDLEEATYSALVEVSKKLSLYGIIMCEDPVHIPYLIGSKYAFEKFLKRNEGNNYLKIFKKNHYFLIKIK